MIIGKVAFQVYYEARKNPLGILLYFAVKIAPQERETLIAFLGLQSFGRQRLGTNIVFEAARREESFACPTSCGFLKVL